MFRNFFAYFPSNTQPTSSSRCDTAGLSGGHFVHQPYGVSTPNAVPCRVATPTPAYSPNNEAQSSSATVSNGPVVSRSVTTTPRPIPPPTPVGQAIVRLPSSTSISAVLNGLNSGPSSSISATHYFVQQPCLSTSKQQQPMVYSNLNPLCVYD